MARWDIRQTASSIRARLLDAGPLAASSGLHPTCSTHGLIPKLQGNKSLYHSISFNKQQIPSKITVAIFDATPYRTTSVSIPLVSVDNSQIHISNALKTQRNSWINP